MIVLCPGCHRLVEVSEMEEEIDIYDDYSETRRVFRCPKCGFKLVRRVRWHRREAPHEVWRCPAKA